MDKFLSLAWVGLVLQALFGPAHDSVEYGGLLGVAVARPKAGPYRELVLLLELALESVQADLPSHRGEVVSMDCAEEASPLMDKDAC